MIEWTRLLRRAETIDALFEVAPDLANFSLMEVCLVKEDDACLLRGTLSEFADFPLPIWEKDANRVGIRLWLEDLEEFEIKGWDFENIIDLKISLDRQTGAIHVVGGGEDIEFRGVCGALHVENVYAYYSD